LDYTFDKAGQLQDITYPTGRKVDYQYDAIGRISNVIATGTPQGTVTLVSNIQYEPFGPIKAYTYGSGLTRTVKYDKAYRQDNLAES
ncbi:MAG TPA: hypothetical protein ENH12_01135, partial [Proteobacteria bacterium]|nr:hypothetical protein [Pseudomonadota bacterium]